jgi:L-2-hydroxyglutarate oxidase LhgO
METVECVVIGAGVVGLAAARALAMAGRDVLLLEAENTIGTATSSRNSEVIHAGIYYPKNSIMAQSCVAGTKALYAYCNEHGIPHAACGKLIVATSEIETPLLAGIKARAAENGVPDLQLLSAAEASRLEPGLHCTGALFSPSTGIIDSHAYMLSLQGDFEAAGGMLAFQSALIAAKVAGNGIEIVAGEADTVELRCKILINAAGLRATKVAQHIEGMPRDKIPGCWFAKGNYFSLMGRAPFSRLIYPVPVSGGLGVHLTLDLGGDARFGPDVEWVDSLDYRVDPARGEKFYHAIRRYWPELPDNALQPAYAGIRPKIAGPGQPAQDFLIQGPEVHGVSGLVNLFGIESPGLTASLALAERVRMIVDNTRGIGVDP